MQIVRVSQNDLHRVPAATDTGTQSWIWLPALGVRERQGKE
jgi:hypothetical protein